MKKKLALQKIHEHKAVAAAHKRAIEAIKKVKARLNAKAATQVKQIAGKAALALNAANVAAKLQARHEAPAAPKRRKAPSAPKRKPAKPHAKKAKKAPVST